MRRIALTVVALHALALAGHDVAHRTLGIGLEPWQWTYAYLVIVAAPILAALALFTRRARAGFALLSLAMSGALLFTVYHHYVLVSPDHVGHLPPVGDPFLFRVTAAALALLELAGVAVGVAALRRPAS